MRALRVSFDGLWTVVAVALPALGAVIAPLSTVDLAYQVRTGDLMLADRAIPATDPFTFSAAGLPWVVQQWGAAVALSLGFRPAAWAGLIVLRGVLVAATFALLLVAARRSGATPRAAALLAIGAFVVALPALGLRAQLFGVLCFAAVLALAVGRRRSPRLFLLVPLVVVAWANLHGSFVFGPLIVAWALLDDLAAGRPAWRRDAVVLALSVAATGITPYGPGVWLYAAGLAASPNVAGLAAEWRPPSIGSPVGLAFFGSALAVAFLLARRGRHAAWPTLLWLGGLFVVGASAERGVVWWALGAAVAIAGLLATPLAAKLAAPHVAASVPAPATPAAAPAAPAPATPAAAPATPAGPDRRATLANGILAIAIGVAPIVVGVAQLVRPADALTGPPGLLVDAPGGITAAVRAAAHPGDRILNAQRWGSWLEWAVPGALMFTDSRFEVVPADAWRDHVAISNGRYDWRDILGRRAPDLIVAARDEQAGLLDAFPADPAAGWRQLYADSDGVVLVRR